MSEIRPVEPTRDNARRLAEINQEVFGPYLLPPDLDHISPDNNKYLQRIMDNLQLARNPDTPRVYLGAYDESAIVGYAYFDGWYTNHQLPFEHGLLGAVAHRRRWRRQFGIHNIGVEPDWRGRGIGGALVAAALEQRPRYATNVAVPEQDGRQIAFFERRQFVALGRGAMAFSTHGPRYPHVLLQHRPSPPTNCQTNLL